MGSQGPTSMEKRELPPSFGYQLLDKDASGEFQVPSGWNMVGLHEMNDPAVQAAFGDLVTGPAQVDKFNNGQMKLIRMDQIGGDMSSAEEWKVVRVANKGDAFDVPNGWSIVDMDESNFGEYLPKVGHLIDQSMAEGMQNGTIKFIVNKPEPASGVPSVGPSNKRIWRLLARAVGV